MADLLITSMSESIYSDISGGVIPRKYLVNLLKKKKNKKVILNYHQRKKKMLNLKVWLMFIINLNPLISQNLLVCKQ